MSPANGGRDTGSCSCSPDLFSASTAAQEEEREGVGRTLHERETMDSSIFAFLFSPIYVNFKTVAEAAVSLLFFLFCFLSFTLE